MENIVTKTLELELYQQAFHSSIQDCEQRRATLRNDEDRAKYINSLIAEFKKEEIDAAIQADQTQLDDADDTNNQDFQHSFASNTLEVLQLNEVNDHLSWLTAKLEEKGDESERNVLKHQYGLLYRLFATERPFENETDISPERFFRDQARIVGQEKVENIIARARETLKQTKKKTSNENIKRILADEVFVALGLEDITEIITAIHEGIRSHTFRSHNDLLEDDTCGEYVKRFLYEAPLSKETIYRYFQIESHMKGFRLLFRCVYQFLTANGKVADSIVFGVGKLWFIFGLIYANVTSEFLSVHIEHLATEGEDRLEEVVIGLKHWGIAVGIVALLAFLVYEGIRLLRHLPVCYCRRREDGSCCYVPAISFALTRMARRNAMRFQQIIAEDMQYDPEAPTYQFQYDPYDDPDVAIYYYHLKEREMEKNRAKEIAQYLGVEFSHHHHNDDHDSGGKYLVTNLMRNNKNKEKAKKT